jgi:hypothetical protein
MRALHTIIPHYPLPAFVASIKPPDLRSLGDDNARTNSPPLVPVFVVCHGPDRFARCAGRQVARKSRIGSNDRQFLRDTPSRHYPRPNDTKTKNLGHSRKQLPAKLAA